VPIIEHSDVKRMLLVQKAYTEGAMALTLYAAHLCDLTLCHDKESSEAKQAEQLLEILTPIAKSWPSEWCLEANKWAIQVRS
jgi:alkylation response protein AidB-like acyl-CoA dehydrogenase